MVMVDELQFCCCWAYIVPPERMLRYRDSIFVVFSRSDWGGDLR